MYLGACMCIYIQIYKYRYIRECRNSHLHLFSTCSVPGNIPGPLHALTYLTFTTTLLIRCCDFHSQLKPRKQMLKVV